MNKLYLLIISIVFCSCSTTYNTVNKIETDEAYWTPSEQFISDPVNNNQTTYSTYNTYQFVPTIGFTFKYGQLYWNPPTYYSYNWYDYNWYSVNWFYNYSPYYYNWTYNYNSWYPYTNYWNTNYWYTNNYFNNHYNNYYWNHNNNWNHHNYGFNNHHHRPRISQGFNPKYDSRPFKDEPKTNSNTRPEPARDSRPNVKPVRQEQSYTRPQPARQEPVRETKPQPIRQEPRPQPARQEPVRESRPQPVRQENRPGKQTPVHINQNNNPSQRPKK